MYEEFHYPNAHKLIPPYSDFSKILNLLSEVMFETDRSNPHFKRSSEIAHSFKIRSCNHHQNFKMAS